MTINWPHAWDKILVWIKATFQYLNAVPWTVREWVTIGTS